MRLVQFVAMSLMCMAALAACRKVNTVERADPVAQPQTVADRRVITDVDLARHARVVGVIEATRPGGFLQVQVSVLNAGNSQQSLYYRYEWFDEAGMLVSAPPSVWHFKTLQGRETVELVGMAPTPSCKDFRLKLQESQ